MPPVVHRAMVVLQVAKEACRSRLRAFTGGEHISMLGASAMEAARADRPIFRRFLATRSARIRCRITEAALRLLRTVKTSAARVVPAAIWATNYRYDRRPGSWSRETGETFRVGKHLK